jgi:hypothetical protein
VSGFWVLADREGVVTGRRNRSASDAGDRPIP